MKKVFVMFVFMALFTFLVACNDGDSNDKDNAQTDQNIEDANSEENAEQTGDTSAEEVTLKIASWSFGAEGDVNLDRMMVDAFMDKYPNIKVEIDESIAPPWEESLATAASAGSMPDVFAVSNIPTALANEWLLDVSEFTSSDEEFALLPQAVTESITYDGGVYAVPSAQHFLGYFVNKDLFEQANLEVPYLGMSLEEFEEAVRNVSDINQGVVGLNNTFSVPEWYPVAASDDLGWYTFNDGFNLDSPEFINGINTAKNFSTNGYAYETLTADQKANFNGENANEAWFNGGIGLWWDGSWAVSSFQSEADFNWDFIGIPGQRNVVAQDFFGISSSTEHPEEAYMLAKWMGFGKEGYMKKIEITDAEEALNLNGVPLINDPEVLDAYFERVNVPGIVEAYKTIDQAVVEPFKTTPGYAPARWEAPTGVSIGEEANATMGTLINASISGDINIENYATQINELANSKYQEAQEAISK
ncbi:extracellular solute-binding protein [Bacillaceae bacterium S4-13-56]